MQYIERCAYPHPTTMINFNTNARAIQIHLLQLMTILIQLLAQKQNWLSTFHHLQTSYNRKWKEQKANLVQLFQSPTGLNRRYSHPLQPPIYRCIIRCRNRQSELITHDLVCVVRCPDKQTSSCMRERCEYATMLKDLWCNTIKNCKVHRVYQLDCIK